MPLQWPPFFLGNPFLSNLVPKERFELSRPCGHYALNVARLPFRHFGMVLFYSSLFTSIRQLSGLV